MFAVFLLSCTHSEKLVLTQLKRGFRIALFAIEVFAEAPYARQMAVSPGVSLLVTDVSDDTLLAFPRMRNTPARGSDCYRAHRRECAARHRPGLACAGEARGLFLSAFLPNSAIFKRLL